MSEQELNRKLAKWAGFKERWVGFKEVGYNEPIPYTWTDPDRCISGEPQFTQSLWLIPKLLHWNLADAGEDALFTPFHEVAKTPALALCLTIEKLIDKGAS